MRADPESATFQGGFIPDTILYLSYWYSGTAVSRFEHSDSITADHRTVADPTGLVLDVVLVQYVTLVSGGFRVAQTDHVQSTSE